MTAKKEINSLSEAKKRIDETLAKEKKAPPPLDVKPRNIVKSEKK